MKYFTPQRYLALQDLSSDAALNAADADWEAAVDQYDAYLQAVLPRLPPRSAGWKRSTSTTPTS
jgi:hypothetical protein